MQLGIHHVETLAYWLGPVQRAAGRFTHVHTEADIDDVGVVTLEFESGALGSLTGSYVSPKTLSLRLLGTEAVLDYRTDFSVWPDAQALDGATTLTLAGEPVEFEGRDMLAEELAEFGRCIRGEAEPETGAEEGIATLAVVLQALGAQAEAVS
jgi:predicted dehydrogenase